MRKSPLLKYAPLVALGIVYGDIGTSPLYAFKECFSGEFGVANTLANVTGVLSLVFWALTWIVVFKYLTVMMHASNRGEGGIMALIALLTPRRAFNQLRGKRQLGIIFLGLFGAALLYGDGVITPAVSVLSAVEGLEVAAPTLRHVVIPLTVGILLALFLAQKKGPEKVGAVFGPMMLIWFGSISAVALPWIFKEPRVLLALNPLWAIRFFERNSWHGLMVLTAVILCVTGAEALYADMGNFGPGPIRKAWYAIVYPSLVLNYFGQGASLLKNGEAALNNPFFSIVPNWFLLPMVLIATLATVIASQALISGVFSMTQQATTLGFLPHFKVVHTSEAMEGQIYIPQLNQFLLISCVALVLVFKSSARLTSAYGIAVAGTMAITSILFYFVSRKCWNWSRARALPLAGLFVLIDSAFLVPNLAKILHGGWVPIVIAVCLFVLMQTWHRGKELLGRQWIERSIPFQRFAALIEQEKPIRVRGTSLFIASGPGLVPAALRQQYRHSHILHEKVLLLCLSFTHEPYVPPNEHVKGCELGQGFCQLEANYGFMETPDIYEILQSSQFLGEKPDLSDVNFYLPHDMLRPGGKQKMARWRKKLFIFVARNSQWPLEFTRLNPDWVVQIGGLIDF